MSVSLSPDTARRLRALFAAVDRREAERLLVDQCGNGLPFCEKYDAVGLERIRFAAMKVSNGNLSALRDAIDLANIDWRDLLVGAGFAEDVDAHKSWFPGEHAS